MKRIWQFGLGLTLAAWASACQEATPANGRNVRDGSVGDEAAQDVRLDAADAPGDARSDLGDAPAAPDVPEAPDLVAEAGKLNEVGEDLGPGCAEGAQQSCASPGNPLVGACHAGIRICARGAWGPCSEILPAAEESCNGIDDNCNGMTDEGCAAGCIVVCASCVRSSDDAAAADGSLDRPFATLEAAIASADAGAIDGGTRSRICVAGGTSCGDAWVYQIAAPITIGDGLIVQGGYAVTPTGLAYCDSPPRPRTTLDFASTQGVVFDQSVVTGAELSGFEVGVTRATTGDFSHATVAVAITGAQNVSLSRIFVSDGMAGSNSYGVSITEGGHATIIGSSINGGQGQASAVGVYVKDGTVNLRNNCDDLVKGNCTSKCSDCGPQLGIRGRVAANVLDAPAHSSAVYVTGQAGSSVVGNMICGGSSNLTTGVSAATAATVLCEGPGCSTVSGNLIIGGSARDTVGLALVGADPRVDSNWVEGGCGTESTTGIWLESSSARVQNNRILGGQCPGTGSPIFQGLQVNVSGTDSPDVHSNDIEPLGLASDCESVGVLLERSSGLGTGSSGLFRNNIISAGLCNHRTAISEANGAGLQLQALVNNDLYDPAPESSAGALVLYHHGDTDATTAAQVNAQPGASGNISADPKYAAYLSDFHLGAGSACIDQGIADGAPDTDADKNQRPVGAGYDIGAHEFQE